MNGIRPKVLVSAFACNPAMGSEPGLGYRYVRALAEKCDLTVITEELQNRSAIEEESKRDLVLRSVNFHFIPWPAVGSNGQRIDHVNFVRYYSLSRRWQRSAFDQARALIAAEQFDLVHHLTMTGYREPGYMWQLPLPFVWGPVGGFVMMPWRFIHTLGPRGAAACLTRNLLNWAQMQWSWRVKEAARSAAALLASTSVDVEAIRGCYGREAVLLGENGAFPAPGIAPRSRRESSPLRIGWSGLHIPRKALPILLNALVRLPSDVAVEVHIAGDGPQHLRWRKIADRLGVSRLCHFHGWLARNDSMALMRSMDVFAVTSLQDAGSAVLFEALSAGLPIIAHRCCGFADALDDGCSVLVPLVSPKTSYDGFAQAIVRLYRDPSLYHRLSVGAISRAQAVSWGRRSQFVFGQYQHVINRMALPVKTVWQRST